MFISAAPLLVGCSVIPLPQDSSGYTTEDIVRNIRCEARSGIHETVLLWLRSNFYLNRTVWKGFRGGLLADRLEAGLTLWHEINVDELDKDIRHDFAFYRNSQIAYQFTLTLEEQNMNDISAGFAQKYSGRSNRAGSLSLSTTSTLTRTNQRSFNVVDTFEELALKIDYKYCNSPRSVDIIYPMRGKLPIQDLVGNYIRINNFGNLGGPSDNIEKIFGTELSPAIPQMGDTITFVTKLASSINPSLTVTPPVGFGFLFSGTGLKSDNYRSDTHRVIIVVSTSPDAAKLKPLNARLPTRLAPELGGPLTFTDLTLIPAPIKNGKLTPRRAAYALETLAEQRAKNRDDDISTIAQALRQMSQ